MSIEEEDTLEDKQTIKWAIFIWSGICILAILGTMWWVYNYLNPVNDIDYCKRNMPEFNNSLENTERDNKCFNELWEYYCHIRSPRDCPGYFTEKYEKLNNFTFS